MINNPNNRVVITGTGILCQLGLDTSVTWEGLIAGNSGIDYITLFDPEPLDTKFAGEVKGFEPTDYISLKDRFAQLAVTGRQWFDIIRDLEMPEQVLQLSLGVKDFTQQGKDLILGENAKRFLGIGSQ